MPRQETDGLERTTLMREWYVVRLSLEDIEKIKKDEVVEKMIWKEVLKDGSVEETYVKVHRGP